MRTLLKFLHDLWGGLKDMYETERRQGRIDQDSHTFPPSLPFYYPTIGVEQEAEVDQIQPQQLQGLLRGQEPKARGQARREIHRH